MAPSRSFRILLVEDNPGDVRLTREALRDGKVDHELDVVPDGEEALRYLHKQDQYAGRDTPDVVLLDLNLPKKDGLEVLAEVKSDDRLKTIPIVVLSTSEAERDIIGSYQLHANCFITKPVDINQFLRVIKMLDDFWFSVVQLPSHRLAS